MSAEAVPCSVRADRAYHPLLRQVAAALRKSPAAGAAIRAAIRPYLAGDAFPVTDSVSHGVSHNAIQRLDALEVAVDEIRAEIQRISYQPTDATVSQCVSHNVSHEPLQSESAAVSHNEIQAVSQGPLQAVLHNVSHTVSRDVSQGESSETAVNSVSHAVSQEAPRPKPAVAADAAGASTGAADSMAVPGATSASFGSRLQAAMSATGIGQRKVAELTGISQSTVSYIVNGKRQPDADIIEKLRKVFSQLL